MSVKIRKERSREVGGCLGCSRNYREDHVFDYEVYEIRLEIDNHTISVRLCGSCLADLEREIKDVKN